MSVSIRERLHLEKQDVIVDVYMYLKDEEIYVISLFM